MNNLLYQFLLPTFAGLTLLFIFIAYKQLTITKSNKKHETEAKNRYLDTKIGIQEVDRSIKNITSKIDKKIIPAMDEVYERVTRPSINFTSETVIQALRDHGYNNAKFITEDKELILTGIIVDELELIIATLINLDLAQGEVLLESYAFSIDKNIPEIYEKLLTMNNGYHYVGIGIEKIKETNYIVPQQTLFFTKGNFDPDTLINMIESLESVQCEIHDYLVEENHKFEEVEIFEYLKLLTETRKIEDNTSKPLTN